jgi:hypothetical protein
MSPWTKSPVATPASRASGGVLDHLRVLDTESPAPRFAAAMMFLPSPIPIHHEPTA